VTIDPDLLNALRDALGGAAMPPGDSDLEAVAACGETIVYRPGDALFSQGEPSKYCHLVVRGVVELFRTTDRERVISVLGSGRFVGDIAVVLGVPYFSSARSGTYAEIHWFERDQLLDVLGARPAVTFGWLRSAMTTLAEAHGRLDVVIGRTARRQVAGALLAAPCEEGRVAMSQHDLASILGVGRQTINKALADLMDDGLVRTGYRFIEIIDRPSLVAEFEGEMGRGGP
jgi:CRP/FNR family transcriptional regulator